MDVSGIAVALQSGLSVVGFLALSFWMMKWAKGLHERNKELGDIDKEIRATMKDSFAAQKELHEIQQKKLEIELSNLVTQMQRSADRLNTEKTVADAGIMTIGIICKLNASISSRDRDRMQEHYLRLIDNLAAKGIVTKERFFRLWKDHDKEKKAYSSVEDEIAVRLTELYNEPTRMRALSDAAVFIAPKVFRFLLDNPKTSEKEVGKFVADFLRQSE